MLLICRELAYSSHSDERLKRNPTINEGFDFFERT